MPKRPNFKWTNPRNRNSRASNVDMDLIRRIPLIFAAQPEGGFTVTSPVLPELVTEGDTLEEAFANVPDALAAVLEIYSEQCRPLPAEVT